MPFRPDSLGRIVPFPRSPDNQGQRIPWTKDLEQCRVEAWPCQARLRCCSLVVTQNYSGYVDLPIAHDSL